MRYTFQQFQSAITNLAWSNNELADKLSAIGFETEADGDALDITLTSNRKDCQELNYLLFDLAGIYNFEIKKLGVDTATDREIPVTLERINKILGTTFTEEEYRQIERLGFIVNENSVAVPKFRIDIASSADIAEEVIRLHSFTCLKLEPLDKQSAAESTEFDHIQTMKFALAAAGWTETATYSFSGNGQVELKNPFRSEEPFLKTTLLDGLLQTLAKNPFMKRALFFEVGTVFNPNESTKLGLICAGYKDKAALTNQLSQILGQSVILKPVTAEISNNFDAKQGAIAWVEINCEGLELPVVAKPSVMSAPLPPFVPISKYPPLVRDVTIVTDPVDSDAIIARAHITFPQLLLAEVIDQYTNPASGQLSTTLRFVFQNMSSSFTTEEIDKLSTELTTFLN